MTKIISGKLGGLLESATGVECKNKLKNFIGEHMYKDIICQLALIQFIYVV